MRCFAILITAAAVCGVVAGCATPGPQATEEQLTRAGTLIEQAEKAQAQRYAAPDLQRARDELRSAQAEDSKASYDAARSDAESAAADADVAAARASEAEAVQAAREARQGNNALQEESGRGTVSSDLRTYPPASPAPAAPPTESVSPRNTPPAPASAPAAPDASPPEPQTNPQ